MNSYLRKTSTVLAVSLASLALSLGTATDADAGRYKKTAPASTVISSAAASGSNTAISAAATTKTVTNFSTGYKLKYCSTEARCNNGVTEADRLYNYVAIGETRTTLRYALTGDPWKSVYNGTTTAYCYGGGYHQLTLAFRQSPEIYVDQHPGYCNPGDYDGRYNNGVKVTQMIVVGDDAQGRYGRYR